MRQNLCDALEKGICERISAKEMYALWKGVSNELWGLMGDTFSRWRHTGEFAKYSVLQLKIGGGAGVSESGQRNMEENKDGVELLKL